jgi:hypothetical protein
MAPEALTTLAHFSVSSAITKRHVNHLDAGHHLEQLAGHVVGSAVAGRRHGDLAR